MSDTDSADERLRLWEDAHWTDKEMFNFAIGVQRYGFKDFKNIAKVVKTKSKEAVEFLIEEEVNKKFRDMFGFKEWRGADNFQSLRPRKGNAKNWPVLRKWQKIAQSGQTKKTMEVDYSCMLIPAMWERFLSEAESPLSSEELDVPALYRYILECVRGESPPELPPKESATMLMLLQLVDDMLNGLDLQEEMEFARKFKEPTTFLPIQDEITLRKNNEPLPADAVFIPKRIEILLAKHIKLVQSFNPLTVPLWLLNKEQKQLHSMFDDDESPTM